MTTSQSQKTIEGMSSHEPPKCTRTPFRKYHFQHQAETTKASKGYVQGKVREGASGLLNVSTERNDLGSRSGREERKGGRERKGRKDGAKHT